MTAARAALLPGLLLALAAAGPSPAPTPPGRALDPRGRWHFEFAGPPRLAWSVLFRRSETEDETRLLVETPAGRWALLSTQPAEGAVTREEVASLRTGESVTRVLYHRGAEGIAECARVRVPDACVVLTGPKGRLAAPLSEFSGREAGALKRRAAALVSPALLADLRGLVPALPIADLAFYSEDFLALIDPALARPPGPDLAAPRRPGCAFDATFGYPCTADERRREEWLFGRRPAPTSAPRRGVTRLPAAGAAG